MQLFVFYFVMVICLSASGVTLAVEKPIQIVGNSEATFNLKRSDQQVRLKGKVGMISEATPRDLAQGQLRIRDFNILLKNVPQQMLSGKRPRGRPKGAMSFSLTSRSDQKVKYESERGVVSGQLAGFVTFPQISEMRRPEQGKHDFYYPQVPAVVDIQWTSAPLEFLSDCGIGPIVIEYRIGVRISANPLTGEEEVISWTDSQIMGGSYGCIGTTRVQRELCVQPVKIRDANSDTNPTGDGFGFGWPGVEEQWDKANVNFRVKPFITITEPDLKQVSQSEMPTLLSKVDDPDCAEVFFTESFVPTTLFGGGVTFSSGTSQAKVISSDDNANDIDFTHLAHELGHAMGLTHPGDGNPSLARPNVTDGSSGTLMCPSGFQNDNPAVNSQHNEDELSNPLFKFKLRSTAESPDCEHDPDCGAC